MENTSESIVQTCELNQTPQDNCATQPGFMHSRFPPPLPNAHSYNVRYGSSGMYAGPLPPHQQGIPDSSFQQQQYRTEAPGLTGLNPNLPSQLHARNPTFSSYVASLPAPPPYTPHQMLTASDQSSFTGRAGPLPMTSPHSTQYLLASQPHLLQLPGRNHPPRNTFASYGISGNTSQHFTSFHSPAYTSESMIKQPSTMGEIMEPDSSSSREATSHINRKKRKACGRCGPCQRKDNCGTCMNCVNRAKGKQICVFRKCEELKKKPGTENYVTPEHSQENIAVRQEKRKDLEQLLSSDRKRSKTEESSTGSTAQLAPLNAPLQHPFSTYTSTQQQQNFNQLLSQPLQNLPATNPTLQPYTSPVTIPGPNAGYSSLNQQQQNLSPRAQNLVSGSSASVCTGQPDTTDIISEALREIENHSDNTGSDLVTLQPLLSSAGNEKREVSPSSYSNQEQTQIPQNPQFQPWNQHLSQVSATPAPSTLQISHSNLPGRPPPTLPPGPGPGSFSDFTKSVSSTAAPPQIHSSQLLGNKYNDFSSFERSNSTPIRENNKLLLESLNAPSSSYASDQQSELQSNETIETPDGNRSSLGVIPANITSCNIQDQETDNCKDSKSPKPSFSKENVIGTTSESIMYHNANTLPFNPQYSFSNNLQNMSPAMRINEEGVMPHYPPHLPHTSHQLVPSCQSSPRYHTMTPLLSNNRLPSVPGSFPPSSNFSPTISTSGYILPNTAAHQATGDPKYRGLYAQPNEINRSPYGQNPSTSMNDPNTVQQNLNVLQNSSKNLMDSQKYVQQTSNQFLISSTTRMQDRMIFQSMEKNQQAASPDNSITCNSNLQPACQASHQMPNFGASRQVASREAIASPLMSSDQNSVISRKLDPSPVTVSGSDTSLVRTMNSDAKNKQISSRSAAEFSLMNPTYLDSANIVKSKPTSVMVTDATKQQAQTRTQVGQTVSADSEKKPFLVHPGSSEKYQNVVTQQGILVTNNKDHYSMQREQSISTSMKERLDRFQEMDTPLQSLPAARSFLSTEGPIAKSTRTAATSDNMMGHDQPLQCPRQSTKAYLYSNPHSVGCLSDNVSVTSKSLTEVMQSPSETNLTISPGESGYDSTEIYQGSDEMRKTQNGNKRAESESFEMKKTILCEDRSKENHDGPKNLHRAPVGSLVGSLPFSKFPVPTDLPSAGAHISRFSDSCYGKSHSIKNTNFAMMKRSLSSDESLWQSKDDEKQLVHLRRYSNKECLEVHSARRFSEPATPFANKKIESCASCAENGGKHNSSYSKPEQFDIYDFPDYELFDNKSSEIHLSKENYEKTAVGQSSTSTRKSTVVENHTFETPPMTPSTCDSFQHKSAGISVFGANISCSKMSDILPTPPYVSDLSQQSPFVPKNLTLKTDQVPSSDDMKGQKDDQTRTQFPVCNCVQGSDGRNDDSPYYTHLGAAKDIRGIRKLFEERTGFTGHAIRIEKVIYTGKEGKTSRGCPIAKWIIRRSSEEEKVLIVCKQRPGHSCATAVIVVIIVLWDGVARPLADFAYSNYSTLVPNHGEPTERRCATNDERTCACQGFDEKTCGASFSFGCSWSMYYNGCKFARSVQPNKYKLTGTKNHEAEKFVGQLCERLATVMSPLYKMAAPDAFLNQVVMEDKGLECRLGDNEEEKSKPFSGVTACLDFCAHSHKDQHNLDNGSTIVLTLTKPELRTVGVKHSDEQLHVLPLYKLDLTNEHGTYEGVSEKISTGAVEILSGFRREVRVRNEPRMTKKQKARAKKKNCTSTVDDFSSPPCKRKGRPPKRTRSAENLLGKGLLSPSVPFSHDFGSEKGCLDKPSFQTPPHVQRHIPVPHFNQYLGSPPPYSDMPTRWPYRRHVHENCDQTDKMEQNVSSASSLDEHLPSIGSFFKEESGGQHVENPDVVNIQNPTFSPTVNEQKSGKNESVPTPLPSIKDVVSHPFHETFAVVNSNQAEDSLPDTNVYASETPLPHEHKISLKAYAAGKVHTSGNILQYSDISSNLSRFAATNNLSPLDPANTISDLTPPTESNKSKLVYSDSEENFIDSEIGGVAIAPGHGSVLIECAKRELHATTPLLKPNRFYPSRISLVFYQHKSLNSRNHGAAEYEAKEEKRQQQREERKLEELQAKANADLVASMKVNPYPCPVQPDFGRIIQTPFSRSDRIPQLIQDEAQKIMHGSYHCNMSPGQQEMQRDARNLSTPVHMQTFHQNPQRNRTSQSNEYLNTMSFGLGTNVPEIKRGSYNTYLPQYPAAFPRNIHPAQMYSSPPRYPSVSLPMWQRGISPSYNYMNSLNLPASPHVHHSPNLQSYSGSLAPSSESLRSFPTRESAVNGQISYGRKMSLHQEQNSMLPSFTSPFMQKSSAYYPSARDVGYLSNPSYMKFPQGPVISSSCVSNNVYSNSDLKHAKQKAESFHQP